MRGVSDLAAPIRGVMTLPWVTPPRTLRRALDVAGGAAVLANVLLALPCGKHLYRREWHSGTMWRMRNWRRIAWAVVWGLLGVVMVACSGDGQADSPRPSTTAPPSTTTTTNPAADIEAAYLAGWDKYVWFGSREGLESQDLAGRPYPEQFRRTFEDVLTGEQYDGVFKALQPIRADSEFRGGRSAIENKIRIVSVQGDQAILRDCYDDNLQTWNRKSNTRLDQDNPQRHLIEVTMVRQNGRWKATKATPMGDGCTGP